VGTGNIVGFLALCNSIKGRLGGVNVAVLYQRPHVPVEEGQKQYAYMRAVHVRIRHADYLVVAELALVKLGVYACAEGTASDAAASCADGTGGR